MDALDNILSAHRAAWSATGTHCLECSRYTTEPVPWTSEHVAELIVAAAGVGQPQ
jgi:hypothetical protein